MVCVTGDKRHNSYSRYGQKESDTLDTSNLELTKTLKPVVYKLRIIDNEAKKKLAETNQGMDIPSFYLEYKYDVVPLPKKIYGKVNRLLLHYLTRFDSVDESLEVLLVGDAGSGKTLLSDMICQSCIDRGMPVIDISGLDIDTDDLSNSFVEFIGQLHNVCIRLDEFGKMIPRYRQQYLLTIMTERHRRIFWILTENSYDYINNFITGSTHRVRYSQEFTKIDAEVVIGYCRDKGVSDKFIDQLLILQNRAKHFSFTHLMTLVEEHMLFPNMGIDEMISLLNLKHLSTVYTINIRKISFCGIDVTEAKKSIFGKIKFVSSRGIKPSSNWGEFTPQASRSIGNRGEKRKDTDKLDCTFEDISYLIRDKYPLTVEFKLKLDNLLLLDQNVSNQQNQQMIQQVAENNLEELIEALKSSYNGNISILDLYQNKKGFAKELEDLAIVKSSPSEPLILRNKYIEVEAYISSNDDDDEIPISYFTKKKSANSVI